MLDRLVSRLRAAGCVFAEDEAALLLAAEPDPPLLETLVARRVAGEPLEHLLGWAGFAGLRVAVAPGVFVPRQRSLLLVRAALEALAGRARGVVVDLCCGSGALGAAVLVGAPSGLDVELHAADLDAAAARCARATLDAVPGGPAAQVHQGDLFDALPETVAGRVDVLLANVPYVPTEAVALMPPEARDHEPRQALDGGPDGLAVLRRVAADATRWLAPGGLLLSECSPQQARAAAAVLGDGGLDTRVLTDDDLGATGVAGALPGS